MNLYANMFALLTATVASAQPSNDECSGATPLTDGFNGVFTNFGATTSTSSCASGNDLWFTYTAQCTASHTFQVACWADRFNPLAGFALEVYSGSCASPISLGCAIGANFCQGGVDATVSVALTGGQTALLRVGGYDDGPGIPPYVDNFGIRVSSGPTTTAGCGGLGICVEGEPQVGNLVTLTLFDAGGPTYFAYGWTPSIITLCGIPPAACFLGMIPAGCLVASEPLALQVPNDPQAVGSVMYLQGLALASDGCMFGGVVPITLSNTVRLEVTP